MIALIHNPPFATRSRANAKRPVIFTVSIGDHGQPFARLQLLNRSRNRGAAMIFATGVTF